MLINIYNYEPELLKCIIDEMSYEGYLKEDIQDLANLYYTKNWTQYIKDYIKNIIINKAENQIKYKNIQCVLPWVMDFPDTIKTLSEYVKLNTNDLLFKNKLGKIWLKGNFTLSSQSIPENNYNIDRFNNENKFNFYVCLIYNKNNESNENIRVPILKNIGVFIYDNNIPTPYWYDKYYLLIPSFVIDDLYEKIKVVD